MPDADKRCVPTAECVIDTPHGKIVGKKCTIESNVYHNSIIDRAIAIGEAGIIKTGQHPGEMGQDVISLSSCPTQGYGGNVKFILKSNPQMRSMCYYKYYENKEADRGIEKEAREDVDGFAGVNRIRGKYGVNLDMYSSECEQISDKDLPLKENLERLEYWIPWRAERYSFNHKCKDSYPGYANVQGYEQGVKIIQDQISRAKKLAEKLEVPFEVKSCFTAMKASWGDRYIPLNKENLARLAKGEPPEVVEGEIPQDCLC